MPTEEIEEITRQIDRITFEDERKGTRGDAQVAKKVKVKPRHFSHILVGIDGSEGSDKAIDWATYLARSHAARITISLVLPPMHPIPDHTLTSVNPKSAQLWTELSAEQEKEAQRALKEAEASTAENGLQVRTRLERGPVVATLAELAKKEKCDLIIVGSHGRRGVKRFLLGSVAEGIKDHAAMSVLIVRNRPPEKKIILPVDGSAPSKHAAAVLAGIMEEGVTWAHVVHVIHTPSELPDALKERWLRATEELRQPLLDRFELPRGSWVHYDILFGEPADEILLSGEVVDQGLSLGRLRIEKPHAPIRSSSGN